jgi:hypothetical protein
MMMPTSEAPSMRAACVAFGEAAWFCQDTIKALSGSPPSVNKAERVETHGVREVAVVIDTVRHDWLLADERRDAADQTSASLVYSEEVNLLCIQNWLPS